MKFLIVDDSRAVQTIIKRALEKSGFSNLEFQTAGNGQEAYEIAQQWQPDLIITDWHMPKMSGMELMQVLRQTGLAHIKIGFVTAEQSSKNLEQARLNGAVFVVSKPCTESDILEAVYSVIPKPAAAVDPTATDALLKQPAAAQAPHKSETAPGADVATPPGPQFEIIKLPALANLLEEQAPFKLSISSVARKLGKDIKNNGLFLVNLYGSEAGVNAISLLDRKSINLIGGFMLDLSIIEIINLNKQEKIDPDVVDAAVTFLYKNTNKLFVGVNRENQAKKLKIISKSVVNSISTKLCDTIDSATERYDIIISQIDYGSCFIMLLTL